MSIAFYLCCVSTEKNPKEPLINISAAYEMQYLHDKLFYVLKNSNETSRQTARITK